MKKFKYFAFSLVFLLETSLMFSQTVQVVPKGYNTNGRLSLKILFHPDSSIVLQWLGNLNSQGFKIKLGSQSGTYDFTNDYFPMNVQGTEVQQNVFQQIFTGAETALPTGRYYGIVTNSAYNTISEISSDENALFSNEFQIVITATTAPTAIEPLGTITNPTPTFSWNAIPGVVSYWLLLSSNPFEITTDSLGNIQIEGANLIWNYTTNQTSAQYGDVNPLNPYDMGTPPPLLSGHTYNYVILNLYEENNPIYGSPVTSGVFSFTYQDENAQQPPHLLTPADSAYFDATPQITFSWEEVDWVNQYTIYLYQRLTSFGGNDQTIDVPIWNASTTNTWITYDAGTTLTKGTYVWYVVPSDAQGAGNASETFLFRYNKELGVFKLKAHSTVDNSALLNFQAQAVAIQGGITPTNPFLVIDAQTYTDSLVLGTYQFTGSKVGFSDTTLTVTITEEHTLSNPLIINFPFTPLPSIVNGTVLESSTNLPIANATVTLTNTTTGEETTVLTNYEGNFSITTEYGSYFLVVTKAGYVASQQIFFNINEQQVTLETVYLQKDEAMLSGKILNDMGEPIQLATITATNGNSSFQTNSTGEGDYSFTLSSGQWTVSAAKTGFVSPEPFTVNLSTGDNLQNQNIVLIPRANQVSGTVYKIVTDGNVVQIPFADITVKAEPISGQPFETVTDNSGTFNFCLRSGTYIFRTEKTGYTASDPIQLTLGVGETVDNLVFTLTPNPCSVSGRVKLADGTSVSNVTVSAENGTQVVTDVNGNYTLSVPDGVHTISATKEGYISPDPITLSVAPGENLTGIDFTLTPNAGIISGSVTNNGLAIVNATITATNSSASLTALTDNAGNYSLSVQPGAWKLTATKSGFIPSDTVSVTVGPGQTSANNNFVLIQNIAYINGLTTVNGTPIGNVSINIYEIQSGANVLTTITNSNGQFNAALEAGKAYEIEPVLSGYSSENFFTNVLAPESQTQITLNLSPNPSSVSGIVYSNTGTTINSAQVTILTTTDDTVKTTFSLSDGSYSVGLNAGNYILKASKPGYSEASINITLSVGQNLTNINPTLNENFASVSGFVRDKHGNGIQGVMVNLLSEQGGKTTFTLSDGSYLANRLVGGIYSLDFSKQGYSDSNITNYQINDGENKTLDIVIKLLNGKLSGTISTTDGIPVPEATVKITSAENANLFSVSNDEGQYVFENLAEGEYTVSATKAGYRSNAEIPFTISSTDSVAVVNIDDFTLNVATINGTVYDANNQTPLPYVTISLTGENGSASATSSASGQYSLTNIFPGSYQLTASCQNYTMQPISVQITDTTTSVTQNIYMTKTTGAITGFVYDETGAPLGFPVTVKAYNASSNYSTQTDASGSFTFDEVVPDSHYAVRTDIYDEGYQNAEIQNIIVLQNQTTNVGELVPLITLSKIFGNVGASDVSITLTDNDGTIVDVQSSNALGDFSFNFLSSGTYILQPRKDGYVFSPTRQTVSLDIYEEKEINFTAQPDIASIAVYTLETDGSPVSGVSVSVINSDTTIVRNAQTNTSGIAVFTELPSDTYLITPSPVNYSSEPFNSTVVLSTGDSVNVNFTLTPNSAAISGKIKKRLTNGSLSPLFDATVEMRKLSSGETFRTTSDSLGKYSFDNLAPAEYEVTVFKSGFTSAKDTVNLTEGNITNNDYVLEPQIVVLHGNVYSRNASDVARINIKAVSPLGEFYTTTNDEGAYVFDELPIYTNENDTTVYNISINDNRYSSISRQIRIPSSALNTEITAPALLLPSGKITVTVSDCSQPLAGVAVTVIKPDGNTITKQTNNDGIVETPSTMFAGDYFIGITANGYLLPSNYSLTLESDTSSATLNALLPFEFTPLDEMLSNSATPIIVKYSSSCDDVNNATAKIYYKTASSAVFDEIILTAADTAFIGEIPPLFTSEEIDYYIKINFENVIYKSDIFSIVPKAAGLLTQVIFSPSLDNVIIRKNDPYKISLILRDGINNSLLEKFVGENHPGKIIWQIPDGFDYEFPNDNDSTQIIITAVEAEGVQRLEVTASLNGISLTQSASIDINNLQIASLSISKPQNRISNRSSGIQFSLTGKDSTGRTVTLGSGIKWSAEPANAINGDYYSYFTETGFFVPANENFFGIVKVIAEDEISGLSDETSVSVYGEVYPENQSEFTDMNGLTLTIPPNAVTVPVEIEMRKVVNKSVKKYVTPLNSKNKFMASDLSYEITYNSSSALPGDSLQRFGTITIPLPEEFKLIGSDKIISYYNANLKRWILLLASAKSGISDNITEYDKFSKFGEYSVLAKSEPLSIKYASVLPNPFSPQIAPVKIGYYLTSDAPPASVTIKIYNINGELVKTVLENDLQYPGRYGSSSSLKEITWDGKTDGGNIARNGRYIVRITASDGKNKTSEILQLILIK